MLLDITFGYVIYVLIGLIYKVVIEIMKVIMYVYQGLYVLKRKRLVL